MAKKFHDYKSEVMEEFEVHVVSLKARLPDELIVGLAFTELVKMVAIARKQRDKYKDQIIEREDLEASSMIEN